MKRLRLRFARFRSQEGGSLAVEMAIVLPVLLVLVFGIVDFGHAWYMKHQMSNAAREGARYATKYWTDAGGNRILPKNLAPSVSNYIRLTAAENGGSGYGLVSALPCNAALSVNVTGAGITETVDTKLAGEDINISLTATKVWFVIGALVPGFGSSKQITVTSTMKCE